MHLSSRIASDRKLFLWSGNVVFSEAMAEKKRSGPGRPALTDSDRRDRYLKIRLRDDELTAIQTAADAGGRTVSHWGREVLLRAARRSKL